ncbi:MAG: histidinol-phosphatase HisJ family protein [Chloroflexi bacterium]|nr:histidinol-phosphatase HisJ family protein [Chloroflexota bacterium]
MTENQPHDLPLDSHLHTDQSPDSNVPIDAYAALALELGIAEIAITDHVDFDPRDPAYEFASFGDRERVVRAAAERWAPRGVEIRFGVELTYHTDWEADVRHHLRRHRYDFTIGSVHDWPGSPYVRPVDRFVAGRSLPDILGPYFEQVAAAARSGLFDAIGHFDVVKRYLYPHVTPADLAAAPELLEPALRAVAESGTALEVNSSGLRHTVKETYPSPASVVRFRELGGERVTAGSDGHRKEWFAWRLDASYAAAGEAGFEALAFRRGGDAVAVPLPARFRHAPAPSGAT